MEKLRTEYPVHMLCANLLQCFDKNYHLTGKPVGKVISNLENCNVTLEDLASTQLVKHVINFNIALKSSKANKRKRILFKNDLLSRNENLIKKWCGMLNLTGSDLPDQEPSNLENLPQTQSAESLPATKKRKLEPQKCMENDELKDLVDYLKTKNECLTNENNELKHNYRRVSDQNRQLTKVIQTFTNNVNEVKATNVYMLSVKHEEDLECEDIKQEEIY